MEDEIMYGGDSGRVWPTNERRASYNEAMDLFEIEFRGRATKLAVLPGEIRSEIVLPQGVTNSFTFIIRSRDANPGMGNVRNTENRLNTNDAFVVTEIGFFFGKQLIADTASKMSLHTFENPLVWTAVPAVGIGQVYNGTMSMIINTVRYLAGLGMSVFRHVAESQQQVAYVVASPAGNQIQRSTWNPKTGFYEMIPCFLVRGGDEIEVTINIPDPADFTFVDTNVVGVLILRGLKAQNAGTQRASSDR